MDHPLKADAVPSELLWPLVNRQARHRPGWTRAGRRQPTRASGPLTWAATVTQPHDLVVLDNQSDSWAACPPTSATPCSVGTQGEFRTSIWARCGVRSTAENPSTAKASTVRNGDGAVRFPGIRGDPRLRDGRINLCRHDARLRRGIAHRRASPTAHISAGSPPRLDSIARRYDSHPHELGLHAAIADEELVNRVLGPLILRKVIASILAIDPACQRIMFDPDHRNTAVRASASSCVANSSANTTCRIGGWCFTRLSGRRPDRARPVAIAAPGTVQRLSGAP